MDARSLKILNNSEQNYPHSMEKQFPRVFEKIMALWDPSKFDAYLAYLADLMATTLTNRQAALIPAQNPDSVKNQSMH